MKYKITIIIIIFILLTIWPISAANIKSGEYLEQYQWSVLEELLSDFKNGSITTDECALYGCYYLDSQEKSRVDNNEKLKLIPKKYKTRLKTKSIEAGPYFFVYFLHKNSYYFNKNTINEYRYSDWCEYEIINDIVKSKKVDKTIQELYAKSLDNYDFFQNMKINLFDLLKYLASENLISYESVFVATKLYDEDYIKFNDYFDDFRKKHNKYKMRLHRYALFDNDLRDKVKKSTNKKAINLINFYYKFREMHLKYDIKQ